MRAPSSFIRFAPRNWDGLFPSLRSLAKDADFNYGANEALRRRRAQGICQHASLVPKLVGYSVTWFFGYCPLTTTIGLSFKGYLLKGIETRFEVSLHLEKWGLFLLGQRSRTGATFNEPKWLYITRYDERHAANNNEACFTPDELNRYWWQRLYIAWASLDMFVYIFYFFGNSSFRCLQEFFPLPILVDKSVIFVVLVHVQSSNNGNEGGS